MKNKEKYKKEFQKQLSDFALTLKDHVSDSKNQWTIKGFIDAFQNIYSISADTKIVSKVLEIHLFPKFLEFAQKYNYEIVLATHQNWYPDISFVSKSNTQIKYAVDLKTTYRKKSGVSSFTLGSHGSYFKERDKKKNIQFPYNQYSGHFCLGVIYTRTDLADDASETEIYQVQELQEEYETPNKKVGEREVTTVDNLKSITSVIKDFDFFAAEKWKIASDKQGSGNTANIGSTLSIDDLRNENGIFSQLGEEWFDEYWINHGSATMVKDGKPTKITTLKDFLEFKGRTDLWDKIVTRTSKKNEK